MLERKEEEEGGLRALADAASTGFVLRSPKEREDAVAASVVVCVDAVAW